MSNLHVKIYSNFEKVLKHGEMCGHVYLVDKGEINVIDSTGLFVIATLPRGSFFGEYQVVHALASPFFYETGTATVDERDEESGLKRSGHWLFSIEKEKFVKIMEKYPRF